ncbi:MAG: YlmC/YmxH family sporulation protein [Firmicutes bacterium]|nr:YlmC/YmxH family sporulation protein [Bacillota bacterium]
MGVRTAELRCKEVICIADGKRLGYISDVEVEIPTGEVVAVIVPGPCRYFGMLGHTGELRIPWQAIKKVGPDIVLVEIRPEECRLPPRKPPRD